MKTEPIESKTQQTTKGLPRNESSLSIVVPVYNEEAVVAQTARDLVKVAEELGPENEVIFVDDGSDDGTAEALAKVPGIRVVRHPENRGYGASLKTGISASRHYWIAITDADGTYPSHRIPELLAIAQDEGCDMVVGSRTGINAHIPLIRRPAKWCITKLASYLCGHELPDLNSGLRVFHRDAINEFIGILPDSFSFTTTITLALVANGRCVKYMPIEYHHRTGRSKIRPIRDTLMFIQLIIRMVMYFNPLRVFIPISVILFALSFAALLYRTIRGRGLASLSVILFVAGVQVLSIGMIADLIDRRLILANRRGNLQGDDQGHA